jgi:hypothetical protein
MGDQFSFYYARRLAFANSHTGLTENWPSSQTRPKW